MQVARHANECLLNQVFRPVPVACLARNELHEPVTIPVIQLGECTRVSFQVPRHQLTLLGRWHAASGWRASAQARWSAMQFDDDRNQFALGSFWALDARVARAVGSRLELFAAGENLTGERWDVGRTPLRTIGPPRTLRAGVRLDVPALR